MAFNYSISKTVVLCLFASVRVDASLVGCLVVDTKKILGILFDAPLSFGPLLESVLSIAWSSFQSLFYAAQSGGFSLPLLLDEVESRIVPLVLFPAAFLLCAEGALDALDRLQLRWARAALGMPACSEARHALLLLQCNWPYRLSTRVIEEAVVALARLRVLPEDATGSRMLQAAQAHGTCTWLQKMQSVLNMSVLPEPIAEIHLHAAFGAEALSSARACSEFRRQLLRRYRLQAVRPILHAVDLQYFNAKTCLPLHALNLVFSDFHRVGARWCRSMRDIDLGSDPWVKFRCWAVIRCTGRWPLCVYGHHELPRAMSTCPFCDASEVGIDHPLLGCPGTVVFYVLLRSVVDVPARNNGPAFLAALFSEPAESSARSHHIRFVSSCVAATIRKACQSACGGPA